MKEQLQKYFLNKDEINSINRERKKDEYKCLVNKNISCNHNVNYGKEKCSACKKTHQMNDKIKSISKESGLIMKELRTLVK